MRTLIRSFNDLMGRLDASLRAQERFVADAAHQMRTPLAGLKMQAEIAMRQRDPLSIHHAMRQIVTSADRTSHLDQPAARARARGRRRAAAARHARPRRARARGDARLGAARAREGHRPRLRGGERPDVDRGQRAPAARGAQQPARQRDRLHPARRARDRARRSPASEPALEVEDNGIGIDEADRERVFERFFRVLGTDDRRVGPRAADRARDRAAASGRGRDRSEPARARDDRPHGLPALREPRPATLRSAA